MTTAELVLFLISLAACAVAFGLEWRAERRRRRELAEIVRRYYCADGDTTTDEHE